MKRLYGIIVLLVCIGHLNVQNIYPEKFTNCNTDHFAMESDTTIAKIEESKLIEVIVSGLGEKNSQKIKGVLSLQIIVDLEGNSCLISLYNKTNIKTNKLNLKDVIDNSLIWNKPVKKLAAVVELKFEGKNPTMRRLGIKAGKGIHELKDSN